MTSWSAIMDIHTGYLMIIMIINYNLRKWWKRVFYHLLDLSIVNANILYNELSGTPINQLDFRVSIISSLLEGHTLNLPQRHYAPTRELPTRLSERPFPIKIVADTPHGGRPQCEVCRSRGKRSQTRYKCKVCNTPLHIDDCFEIYHTVLYYHRN